MTEMEKLQRHIHRMEADGVSEFRVTWDIDALAQLTPDERLKSLNVFLDSIERKEAVNVAPPTASIRT